MLLVPQQQCQANWASALGKTIMFSGVAAGLVYAAVLTMRANRAKQQRLEWQKTANSSTNVRYGASNTGGRATSVSTSRQHHQQPVAQQQGSSWQESMQQGLNDLAKEATPALTELRRQTATIVRDGADALANAIQPATPWQQFTGSVRSFWRNPVNWLKQ